MVNVIETRYPLIFSHMRQSSVKSVFVKIIHVTEEQSSRHIAWISSLAN